jgi:hypothetical protein
MTGLRTWIDFTYTIPIPGFFNSNDCSNFMRAKQVGYEISTEFYNFETKMAAKEEP